MRRIDRRNLKVIKTAAFVVLILGGLNWGWLGFFGYDLLADFVWRWPALLKLAYQLVGLSALVLVFARPKMD